MLLLLQYQFWEQHGKVRQLRSAVDSQAEENERLTQRNTELIAEVEDLRAGEQAVEERARSQLGLIGAGEQFIQLVPESVFEESQTDRSTQASEANVEGASDRSK